MPSIGRNDPCPCGSGKKYKRCCFAKEPETKPLDEKQAGVSLALDWLYHHHHHAMRVAVDTEFFASIPLESRDQLLGRLTEDDQEAIQICSCEWLLAEAELDVSGRRVRSTDLVLGPGGPRLTGPQRAWLEAMAHEPIGLYEVVDVEAGRGLWLEDALQTRPRRKWVTEVAASRSLPLGAIIGVRIIPDDPAVLSGCLYDFPRDDLHPLRERLGAALSGCSRGTKEWRRRISREIIDAWLAMLTAAPPQLVDRSTGDPIELATDHYDVRDWARLGAALAAQPDVEGDAESGWVRFEPSDGTQRRPRFGLSRGERADSLEVFSRTLRMADESRGWIERIAGDALVFRERETVDPTAIWRQASQPASQPTPLDEISPGEMTELLAQAYRQTYDNWADEPLPALGHRTPREAARTQAGRRAVVDLLRTYELNEHEQATAQGREPVDFGFLWKSVGLKRPRRP